MGRKIAPINDFRAWWELRKIIKDIKPLIVHTHTFKAGLIGRLIGGNHKRVHTFHGHLFDDQSFSSLEKYIITSAEKFLANRTNLLISVGKKVGVELRAQGIGSEKEWISIPPGLNKLPSIEKRLARKSLGLSVEGVLFGWMARMAEVKNPFLLLEIARQLPEVSFVMAGGGELLVEIKLKAPKNVTVIGWADAAIFWSAVDCAVSTSDNEGMPVALIEAQLAGVPVIATDVGSNAEVIEDGVTGIVTSKSPQDLIDAIKKLVKDENFIQKLGDAGRERATEEFSLEKMLYMHKRAYLNLIK
jgi:glycosyltransferase involved in cell wall biosynthesis